MADEQDAAGGEDWTVRATDLVQSTVEAVRTKTVVPLTKVAQIVVFGILVATAALAAGILLVIGLVRLIDSYLPVHPHARAVWVTYAGLGAIFVLAGAFLMRKRAARPDS
jgi:predicted lysophospholipase L1 biosynthesis ABC-type transport system permease subunit